METAGVERTSAAVTALRIFSSVATLVFAAAGLVVGVLPGQSHRWPLLGMFVASAAVCAVISRAAHHASQRRAEQLLVVLCVLPTLDVLLGIWILDDIGPTDFLFLVFLAFGLLTMRWTTFAAMVGGSFLVWLTEVSLLGFPRGEIAHDSLQLLLRAVFAFAVFKIRARLDADLTRTGRALDEQFAANEEVRELRERDLRRYRALFDDGPTGIVLMDGEGVILDANGAALELLDRPREHLVGRGLREFAHVGDQRRASDRRTFAELAERRGAMSQRLVRGDGSLRITTITVSPVAGPEGEAWLLAHLVDDTERESMQEDLVRSRNGMRAVADIASAAQRAIDPRPVALAHLQRLADARLVCLAEKRDEQTLVFTASLHPELMGAEVRLDEASITVDVWNTGESVFVSDASTVPGLNRRLLDLVGGGASFMWQPVGAPGRLQGVLAIGWDVQVTTVSDVERDAVRTIAAELSSALQAEGLRTQLEYRTMADPLTGLLNRRGWDHQLAQLLEQSRQQSQPMVLAVADLDHFKQFNDEFGHLEGDILLSGFATACRATLRDKDVVARWGGEEFTIALANCDMSAALPVLDRIRLSVPAGRTCSIGFATYHPEETLQECLRRVDAALYRAKDLGRNRVEYSRYDAPVPSTEGPAQDVVAHPR